MCVYQRSGPASAISGGYRIRIFSVGIRILPYSLEAVKLTKIIGNNYFWRKNIFTESFTLWLPSILFYKPTYLDEAESVVVDSWERLSYWIYRRKAGQIITDVKFAYPCYLLFILLSRVYYQYLTASSESGPEPLCFFAAAAGQLPKQRTVFPLPDFFPLSPPPPHFPSPSPSLP